MLSEMEKIIAEALIADGKLTQSDLDEWLAAAGNEDQSIEDLLMKNRTAAGSTIRRIRERIDKDSGDDESSEVKNIGHWAMNNFKVSQEDVDRCVAVQDRLWEEERILKHLGEIFVSEKVLSPSQVRSLLYSQDKLIVQCQSCENRFNINRRAKKLECPDCGGVLQMVSINISSLAVDGEAHVAPEDCHPEND